MSIVRKLGSGMHEVQWISDWLSLRRKDEEVVKVG